MLDVGKQTHRACALDPSGKRLLAREVETTLCEIYAAIAAVGQVLVVVDELQSIEVLPVAVMQSMDVITAYLPR